MTGSKVAGAEHELTKPEEDLGSAENVSTALGNTMCSHYGAITRRCL